MAIRQNVPFDSIDDKASSFTSERRACIKGAGLAEVYRDDILDDPFDRGLPFRRIRRGSHRLHYAIRDAVATIHVLTIVW